MKVHKDRNVNFFSKSDYLVRHYTRPCGREPYPEYDFTVPEASGTSPNPERMTRTP